MEYTAKDLHEILKTLVIQQSAETSARGTTHASRIAYVKPGTWQADLLRASAEVKSAKDSAELRTLMGNRAGAVIFLPREAMVTADIIDRICYESPFDKLIIWERL